MANLKLYDFAESVCCQKVRLAIAEKGITVDETPVPLDQGAQFDPIFLKLNPKAIVPVAVHDDRIILESTIISEYIDDAFDGPALMPTTPYDRAQVRYWSVLVDQGIHNPHTTVVSFVVALRYAFLNELDTPEKVTAHLENVRDPVSREMQRQGFELAYKAPAFKIAVKAFDALLEEMNTQLNHTEWLAGSALTLGDLNLAPYIHRLDCLGLSEMWSARPNLSRWYSTLQSRDSWSIAIQQAHIQKWVDLMAMGGREAMPHVREILAE